MLANLTGDEENIVPVSGGNPTTIDEPINLSLDLPMDFIDLDLDFAFVNHQHNEEEFTYLGELAPEEDGLRTLSFCSLGLSPFEITTDTMPVKTAFKANGTTVVDLYFATIQDAVKKVER